MSDEIKDVEVKQENKPSKEISLLNGILNPTTSKELVTIINQIAIGGGFPERFDTLQKKIAAYNLARSLMGGNWQLAINNIAIIKGQMCIYGELPGTLAEQTKEVQEKRVFLIDKDYNEICVKNKNLLSAEPWAAVCLIQRKGRALKEFFYTMDDAKKAGQYPAMRYDKKTGNKVENTDSPWMKFTKIMLMRKAMGLAIKFEFPESFVGVSIAEIDHDVAPDLIDVPRDVVDPEKEAEDVSLAIRNSCAIEATDVSIS